MLDPQRLLALDRFARTGTIAGAAASLGYSPAAVSQQIAALEREVGVALLERSARSASLTPAGEALARRAAGVLDALEQARAEALAAGGRVAGTLSVSVVPTTATVLAPVLVDLMTAHPGVNVVLHQTGPGEALAMVRGRELDLAVVDEWERLADPGLSRTPLTRDPLLLALPATHPGAGDPDPASLADVAAAATGRTWLCAPRDQPSRAATDRVLRRSGAVPSGVWELEGLATIARLVADGVGIAVLPGLALRDVDPGSVSARPLRPGRSRSVVAVTRGSARRNPLVATALSALRGVTWAHTR